MSARACITTLLDDGQIDKERAGRFLAELDRLESGYRKQFGDTAGVQAASADLIDRLEADAAANRRQKLIQLTTQKTILSGLVEHVEGGGRAGQYAIALFDHHEAVPGVSNISNRHTALRQLAWSRMGDFLVRFKRDMLGNIRSRADLYDFVRELFGEKTGNANASELALAFGDTAEWLRHHFNVAGGHIPKLESWGLPQMHDSITVARAGFDNWYEFIRPKLDASRMIDGATGKGFTDEGLDEALQSVWRTIASDGLDKLEPGQVTGSKIANQRADHRFLIFKDADSWLDYNGRFGSGDPFNSVTGHIDGMAKDIAAMQVLGPNPGLTVKWLGDMLRKGAAPSLDGGRSVALEAKAARAARVTDRMWRYYRGELTAPDPSGVGTARFFAGLRNWNVAVNLGGATLSAITSDPVLAGFTAKFNGLGVTRLMANYADAMKPLGEAGRAEALHAGIVFNEMTTRAEQIWRNDTAMRLNVHEVTRRLSDGVMRASLLAPHTVAMKEAVAKSFMMDMAEVTGKSFDQLERADRLRFQRYGIDAATWDFIRETPVYDQEGHRLLRPGDVASREEDVGGRADQAALKILEMIDSETRFAVPGESLRAQTALALGGRGTALQRGTVLGETVHSMTQFKTYSVIVLMTHMQRAIYGNGGLSRATYASMLPLFLTLGGGMTILMKDLFYGKDPEPINTPEFWGRAFVQGGGAGMAGDFVSAGVGGRSRTDGTIAGYLAGPTVSNVLDPAIDLTLGSAGRAASGKSVGLQHQAIKAVQRNTPGLSIFYARLAAQRMLIDPFNRAYDPGYALSWERMGKRAAEQRTQYYWAPGDTSPARAPDFDNAWLQGEEE